MDDVAAVARARAGDLDAFDVLVARYTASAHRTAVLLGAGDEADDMVQEAFVKAYRQLAHYRGESGFRPWLLAIVTNDTRNLHRTRTRRTHLVQRVVAREGPEQWGDDPAETVAAFEQRQDLIVRIRRLERHEQEVLICRYLLDLSEAETATTLALPKGTVKSRTARALAKLRERCGTRTTEEVPGA